MRARIRIVSVTPDILTIADKNDGARSITNDAEAVTAWCWANYPNRVIHYIDTENHMDELKHENGVFTGFGFL